MKKKVIGLSEGIKVIWINGYNCNLSIHLHDLGLSSFIKPANR